MDAAPCATFGEGGEEERCALRGLILRWLTEVDALLGIFLLFEGEDVDVFGFHEFLLDSRWCEVDEVTARRFSLSGQNEFRDVRSYSSRILAPPPVPVTQPKCQNFSHRDGMRLAGWFGSSDLTRCSLVLAISCDASTMAILCR